VPIILRSLLLSRLLLTLALVLARPLLAATAEADRALSLLDYVAVEYPQFVRDGAVLDPDEYAEQVEFSGRVVSLLKALPPRPGHDTLLRDAEALAARVAARADGAEVAQLAGQIKQSLIATHGLVLGPAAAPDMSAAASLYAARCAQCHGAQGGGDGPAAGGLDPRPTAFTAPLRQSRRSVQALHGVISQGVDGTSMAGFTDIPEADRWALAFHVSRLATDQVVVERGRALWAEGRGQDRFRNLADLVLATPEAATATGGADHAAILAFLRSEPGALTMAGTPASSPITRTRRGMQASLVAYEAGDASAAYEHAIGAYLEGFELAEARIDGADPAARRRIEAAMLDYRNGVRAGLPVAQIRQRHDAILADLDAVERRIAGTAPSVQGQFVSAMVIVLREGLEALLVLAGMAAFLVRTGRRDGLRHLHAGWIAAIALGVLTWWVATRLIDVSGAQREVTEGVTALLASAMLLYVGFWLHSKSHGQRWSAFIRGQVSGALGRGTLWGLSAISFLAVYREVFETVLFYQALVSQGDPAPVAAGFAVGCAVLAVLAWVIVRSSVKLPLGLVFGVSSILLAAFAVVFAGRGVAALQAAGRLPLDPLPLPAVPWLGLYPNVQGLALQFGLVLLIVFIFVRNARSGAPAR
jgi:high-affinity iron transporter